MDDPRCHFCHLPISPGQGATHHLVARADGGAEDGATVACHRDCHHRHHRENGDYARWRRMNHAQRLAAFGAEETHRLLAFWGRQGGRKVVAERGPAYWSELSRRGGLARAANGRDSRGRFITHRRADELLGA